MIYFMPIDECSRCGARTPRIYNHRCPAQTNGSVGAELEAELRSWIASQVTGSSARPASPTRLRSDLRGAIRSEPGLSAVAKRHLIGLIEELRRSS
jgi:hypothetical protein